jgi:hypothetical protein
VLTPVSTTNANANYRSVRIPQTVIDDYCGDLDGCQVIIGMRYWWSGSRQDQVASYDFHWFYDTASGWWRRSDSIGSATGRDGASGTEHVLNAYSSCYFTDGDYSNGSDLGDAARGMSLLYWSGYFNMSASNPRKQCELTIID